MNNLPTPLPCADQGCSTQSHTHTPIDLSRTLARFKQEAVRGVCDTGRYRMPYWVWGAGPPLVLIHGVSDSSQSFLFVASHLACHFRCIGYDLPDGKTDGARLGRYSHELLVSDLLALVDHLQVPRSYLLASSFGATIGLRALRQHPERFPRAALQGGLAYRPLRRAEGWLAWVARWLPGSMGSIPKRERLLEKVHKHAFKDRPEEFWRAFVDWTAPARLKAVGHQAKWLHGLDLRPELPQIQQPVLLITGDRDSVVGPIHAAMLLEGLPNARQAVIEGAGHVPAYTHPEALAAVVERFLTPPGQENTCPGAANCGMTCPQATSSSASGS